MIESTIKDGIGRGHDVAVNYKHAMCVSPTIPPIADIGTENSYRFLSEDLTAMNVDGSVTVQEFNLLTVSEDYDMFVRNIIIRIADTACPMNRFGNITGITNGWDLSVTEGGVETFLVQEAKTNGQVLAQSGVFDLFGSGTSVNVISNWTGTEDALIVNFRVQDIIPGGIRLGRGSDDKFTSYIRDDLTGLTEFHIDFLGYKHLKNGKDS